MKEQKGCFGNVSLAIRESSLKGYIGNLSWAVRGSCLGQLREILLGKSGNIRQGERGKR